MKLNNCVSAYNIFPPSSSGGKHSLIQDFQSRSLGGRGERCWENFMFGKFNCFTSDISFLLCIIFCYKNISLSLVKLNSNFFSLIFIFF